MDRIIWRLLMWIWVRRAQRLYGGPGKLGELFNTACFQQAAGKTTGQTVGDQTSRMWLVEYGYFPGAGGCHWFRSQRLSVASRAPDGTHECYDLSQEAP